MEKIAIIYFSGTGNTEQIALKYKEYLSQKKEVFLYKYEDLLYKKTTLIIKDFHYVGIAFPVHAFGTPKIMKKLNKVMPYGENIKTFLFKTMADSFINGGSNYFIKKELEHLGYDVFYETFYIMPSNFITKYSEEKYKQLYKDAIIKIINDTNNIMLNKQNLIKDTFFIKLFSKVINSIEIFGTFFLKYHFYVKKTCILCAKCETICPVKNIYILNSKVKFRGKCTICMRCFYECPQNAIDTFPSIKVKNYQNIKKIIS